EDLLALKTKIDGELSRRPEYFITQPREVRVLQQPTPNELQQFARAHSWSVVRRLGGKQYQFYNDTYTRSHNPDATVSENA
ncbi:MAG: hypothetical protein JO201_06055, partial [Verrucomicrobia bacterium]|nr:hypothetical protein [Verrucomicrobiota bacterium]